MEEQIIANHHSAAAAAAVEEWTRFFSRCFVKRLDFETFETYVAILHSKYPLPPIPVADLLLRPRPGNSELLDPRTPRYLQILMQLKYVDTTSILRALYKYSTSHAQSQSQSQQHATDVTHDGAQQEKGPEATKVLRWGSSYGAEEVIFYRLTKSVAQGTGIKTATDAIAVAKIMAKWMTLFTAASAAFAADMMGQLQNNSSRDEMESARAAFVMLLLGVCENQVVLTTLKMSTAKESRRALSESLAAFVPSILQSSSQIAARLELFRTETLAGFEPIKKKETADKEIDDLLDSTMGLDNFVVSELPITNSRAGLYIYLNAALVGRPLIDDPALFNYLHNRYQGDLQATAIDLILSSFDVLANAVFRNEGRKAGHLLRSYLINKVPLLLASLAASASPMCPLNSEHCIIEALSQVDTNAFPTLSSMFDDTRNNNTFTDSVRQDFCFACCLHGLIPESSIETLLGEITYQTLPASGRYQKENLVQQCLADPERLQGLVGELDNMDGNVGAVCQALTEVLGRLCNNKETMSLKTLCTQLARKPLSLDVLLLFDKPPTILHPLCELLDNWRYDEDQGEYQPVYEEFGAILLLLLAFVHRYNLSASDLGIRAPDSFVAKLLSKGQLSRPLDELSEQEKGHLDGWIHGLFDSDAGGLGDELMSSCPPQDFYLLIPTLFHNIILAFSTNHLTEDGLKGGVEYLVDTFLLPSLVPAILYLSNSLWADRQQDQSAIVKILQLIVKPNSISSEATTMLTSVLNITAKPLEYALRAYQRQDPQSQDIEPLLKSIKENSQLSRRTGSAYHNELEAWTSTPNGGLATAIRHTFQGFVQWGPHSGLNIMPTSYTHRQILTALKTLGAQRLLRLILEETKHQTETGSGSIAYDVATALVCAQDVTNESQPFSVSLLDQPGNMPVPQQRRRSLRETLKSDAEEWKKIQKTDPLMAETTVRLYRKVEAQLVVSRPEPVLQPDLPLEGDALDDAIAAASAVPAEPMNLDTVNLDLGLGGGGADLTLGGSSANSASALDLGAADQDVFGGLGSLDGWDGMDGLDLT